MSKDKNKLENLTESESIEETVVAPVKIGKNDITLGAFLSASTKVRSIGAFQYLEPSFREHCLNENLRNSRMPIEKWESLFIEWANK